MTTTMRMARFDHGEAAIETFDAKAVGDRLDNGGLVLLIGIAADGIMTVFESATNPAQEADHEPMDRSTGALAQLALTAMACGCKTGKRCVQMGSICVRGAINCSPNTPPCS